MARGGVARLSHSVIDRNSDPKSATTARDRRAAEIRRRPRLMQALVTAELEGTVSNSRMQQVSARHPADLTKMLQGLVAMGLLQQSGQKRGATYTLGEASRTAVIGGDSYQIGAPSYHRQDSPDHLAGDLPETLRSLPSHELSALTEAARPAREDRRIDRSRMRDIVTSLCDGRYLTAQELAALLNRSTANLRTRVLTPLVRDGLLRYRYADEPTKPEQAYTTTRRVDP